MNLERSILKVLVYFDMFQYPVTFEEVRFFIDQRVNDYELMNSLRHMVDDQQIFRINEFYSLHDDKSLAERRIKGNRHAEKLLKRAYSIASFLFQFPFVRGIGISGSLSKNFADVDADIDFFIITASNRVWIARTLMHAFKKLTYIFGKQHWFCMNYYIDEDAMLIQERNIFTAMELITLLPVCGNGTMARFFDANDWAKEYYPSYRTRNFSPRKNLHDSWYKKLGEYVLGGKLGNKLENYFFQLTSKRWAKKEIEQRLNIKGNRMGLRTGRHFSKPNPEFFQKKILIRYYSKLAEFDPEYNRDMEKVQLERG